MTRRFLGIITFLAACSFGCAAPLEFPEWTLPVADGVQVHEYRQVDDTERESRLLEAERDLVVGADDNGEGLLYRPEDFAVSDDGYIWVVSGRARRVVVFDSNGALRFRIGGPGQGPGEFRSPYGIALIGDRIVVADAGNRRMSTWSRDGVHLSNHVFADPAHLPGMLGGRELSMIVGAPGDTLLAALQPPLPIGRPVPEAATWRVSRFNLDAEEVARYIELRPGELIAATPDLGGGRLGLRGVGVQGPRPLAAFAADGIAYVTAGTEYQILAIGSAGEPIWALRVAWTPEVFGDQDIEAVLTTANAEGREPLVHRQDVNWPERHPAITGLSVDGRGNLYVFRERSTPAHEGSSGFDGMVAVDVYSPEGVRLFAGLSTVAGWHTAVGEHVYRVETDPATEEHVVARYRLVEPFD